MSHDGARPGRDRVVPFGAVVFPVDVSAVEHGGRLGNVVDCEPLRWPEVAVEHAVGELMFGINLLSFSVTDEEVPTGRTRARGKKKNGFSGSGVWPGGLANSVLFSETRPVCLIRHD